MLRLKPDRTIPFHVIFSYIARVNAQIVLNEMYSGQVGSECLCFLDVRPVKHPDFRKCVQLWKGFLNNMSLFEYDRK